MVWHAGLVWTPDGQEIWFTASELGLFHYISAVTLNKQQRLVTRVPGSLVIFDIWKDGRVLLARADRRREAWASVLASARTMICPGWTTHIPPISPAMARPCCSTRKASAAASSMETFRT